MKDKIDHVVVLMLENRSLDNVLGWLYDDDDPSCQPSQFLGADTTPTFAGLQTGPHTNQYDGRAIPATRGTSGDSGHFWVSAQPLRVPGMDPHETYAHVNRQLFGSPDDPTTTNPPSGTPAAMAGFAEDYDAAYETWEQLDQVMEAYSPEQLPILNGLARAYAVSDAWHSSVPTQTNPNRAFSLCGTSLGRVDNNSLDAVEQFPAPTIFNRLPSGTSWGIYFHDVWKDGQCYTQYTFPRIGDVLDDDERPGAARPGERDAPQTDPPKPLALGVTVVEDPVLKGYALPGHGADEVAEGERLRPLEEALLVVGLPLLRAALPQDRRGGGVGVLEGRLLVEDEQSHRVGLEHFEV